MRAVILLISIFIFQFVGAQWEFGTRLNLVGDSSNQRQVFGVNNPTDLEDGVPADAVRDQKVMYDEVNGGAIIQLNLSPAPVSYVNGLTVSFALTTYADSAAPISVNGLGNVPLVKNGGISLDSAELRLSRPYHAIYYNSIFHLLSTSSPACPFGFEIVTKDYCMESFPTTATTFFNAARQCSDRGGRLCSMGEWMRGCKKTNLSSTITNWEWVDSAANHSGDAKLMGLDPVTFSTPDCEYGITRAPSLSANVRCCYSR